MTRITRRAYEWQGASGAATSSGVAGPDAHGRRAWRVALAAIPALAVAVVVLWAVTAEPKPGDEIGFFGDLRGHVVVKRGSIAVAAGYPIALRHGDIVETGPDGRAEVILPGEGFRSIVIPSRTRMAIASKTPAPRAALDLAKHQVEAANYRAGTAWTPASRLPRSTAMTTLPLTLDWRHLSPEGLAWTGRLTLYDGSVPVERLEANGSAPVPQGVALARGRPYGWELDLPGGRLSRGDFTYLDEAAIVAVEAQLVALNERGDLNVRERALGAASILVQAGLLLRAEQELRDALAQAPDDAVLARWLGAVDRVLEHPSAASRRNTVENLLALAQSAAVTRSPSDGRQPDPITLRVDGPKSSQSAPGRTPAGTLTLHPGDRLTVRVENHGSRPAHTTMILADARNELTALSSPRAESARVPTGEARAFHFSVTPGSTGRERLIVVAILAEAGDGPLDAGFLANPAADYVRGRGGFERDAKLAGIETFLLRLRLANAAAGLPAHLARHLQVRAVEWEVLPEAE